MAMIRDRRSDERGIALALAIFALVVIGALVAANFFVGRLEQQSGQNSLYARQAAEGAESGLLEAVALLPASTLVGLPQGVPLNLGSSSLSPGVQIERQVTRLTDKLFFVRVRSTRQDAAGAPLAASALGGLIRLVSDTPGGPLRVAPLRQRGWAQLY